MHTMHPIMTNTAETNQLKINQGKAGLLKNNTVTHL